MASELVPCEWRDGLTGVQCRLQEGHTGAHVGRVEDVIAATESAHERAFRAMREALEAVKQEHHDMPECPFCYRPWGIPAHEAGCAMRDVDAAVQEPDSAWEDSARKAVEQAVVRYTEAERARADRLAAALREYGDLYGEGEVWHEWGCPGWQSADLGMCTPRCAESRAVLDDTYQPRAQMSPQRPRHPVADVLTDDMIRAALADSPTTEAEA